jgi:hypothetical protein
LPGVGTPPPEASQPADEWPKRVAEVGTPPPEAPAASRRVAKTGTRGRYSATGTARVERGRDALGLDTARNSRIEPRPIHSPVASFTQVAPDPVTTIEGNAPVVPDKSSLSSPDKGRTLSRAMHLGSDHCLSSLAHAAAARTRADNGHAGPRGLRSSINAAILGNAPTCLRKRVQ